jgi:hypothetical protein
MHEYVICPCFRCETQGMSKDEVDQVVLVGGSTRIPKVSSETRPAHLAADVFCALCDVCISK